MLRTDNSYSLGVVSGISAFEEGVLELRFSVTSILERGHLSRFLTNFSCSQLECACTRRVTFNPIWMQNYNARQLAILMKRLHMSEVAPRQVSPNLKYPQMHLSYNPLDLASYM